MKILFGNECVEGFAWLATVLYVSRRSFSPYLSTVAVTVVIVAVAKATTWFALCLLSMLANCMGLVAKVTASIHTWSAGVCMVTLHASQMQ